MGIPLRMPGRQKEAAPVQLQQQPHGENAAAESTHSPPSRDARDDEQHVDDEASASSALVAGMIAAWTYSQIVSALSVLPE